MSKHAMSRLAAPFFALGLLITIVIGMGILASQPVITAFALYSSVAFLGYTWFVGRSINALDLIFWALPGAIAASVATMSIQPGLVRGQDPTVTAIGAGALYGAMVGVCVAFWWAMVPRWSAAVGKWACGFVALTTGAMMLVAYPACACSNKAKAYQATMRSDLRNLATTQEAHYSDHRRYAATVGELEWFQSSHGVHLQVLAVSDSGWMATATHDRSEAICRIFIGAGVPQHGKEGEPRCLNTS